MENNLFSGKRIKLTSLNKNDISELVKWEENTAYLRLLNSETAAPRTETEINEWLENLKNDGNEITFAIRIKKSETLIGILGFNNIEWKNQLAEYFIGIGNPAFWNQGYGSEATQMAVHYAFQELNLHRLQITVFEYNQRAISVYEKSGFVKEGIFREFILRDGKRYDMYLYGLLRPEWEAANR